MLFIIFALIIKHKAMKKYLLLTLFSALFSCSVKTEPSPAGLEYCKTISGIDCLKATITDGNVLIIAIDAEYGRNYDALARYYLNDAIRKGVTDVKMCAVVNYSTSEFQDGAVIGERVGKAFK